MTSENIIQGNTIKPILKSLNKRYPVLSAHAQDRVSCQIPMLNCMLVGGNSEQTQILTCLEADLTVDTINVFLGVQFTHGLISLNFYSNKLAVTGLT